MRHTGGIVRGLFFASLIIFGLIAAATAVGFAIAGIFGGGASFIIEGFIFGTFASYMCYQPRNGSFVIGVCAAVAGWMASMVAAILGGFLGWLLAVLVGTVMTFGLAILAFTFLPRQLIGGEPWRKVKGLF